MADLFKQVDKLQHMLLCSVFVVWFKAVLGLFSPYEGLMNTVSAGLIVLIVAITKEIYDKVSKKGVASWKDFLADICGILFTMLPLMMI